MSDVLPWDDPNRDVAADIVAFKRHARNVGWSAFEPYLSERLQDIKYKLMSGETHVARRSISYVETVHMGTEFRKRLRAKLISVFTSVDESTNRVDSGYAD